MTLEKSWMDGSDKSSLAVLTAQEAHGLTADVAARRLYWISDFKKVSSGRRRQTGDGSHGNCGYLMFFGVLLLTCRRPLLDLLLITFFGISLFVVQTG